MGVFQMNRILKLLVCLVIAISSLNTTKPNDGKQQSAAEIFKLAQENREFCGLENCYNCLHMLQKRGTQAALRDEQISAYWTCTVIWLWNQCCPQWSAAVQML